MDMPLAQQIVQVGHACLLAGQRFAPPADTCHLIVLGVLSVEHLRDVVAETAWAGVRWAVFHEPDDGLGDTAACTAPLLGVARRVFRRLPLWQASSMVFAPRGPP